MNSTIRSDVEKNHAIYLLTQNKKECTPKNIFGEDNLHKIDIMIDVITNNRDQSFIYQTYSSTLPNGEEDTVGHGNWVAAMIAFEYLRGEHKISELLYPTK
jgi:hypothetical protein